MADEIPVSTPSAPPTSAPRLSTDNGLARVAQIRAQMERTTSESIREEGKELRQAAEQSLNIILDLTLDGNVRWVSPTWTEVVGTDAADVQGKPVADIVSDRKDVFSDAATLLRDHGHSSKVVRFSVVMGPKSRWRKRQSKDSVPDDDDGEADQDSTAFDGNEIIDLEAQGILVYDRSTGEESHVSLLDFPSSILD